MLPKLPDYRLLHNSCHCSYMKVAGSNEGSSLFRQQKAISHKFCRLLTFLLDKCKSGTSWKSMNTLPGKKQKNELHKEKIYIPWSKNVRNHGGNEGKSTVSSSKWILCHSLALHFLTLHAFKPKGTQVATSVAPSSPPALSPWAVPMKVEFIAALIDQKCFKSCSSMALDVCKPAIWVCAVQGISSQSISERSGRFFTVPHTKMWKAEFYWFWYKHILSSTVKILNILPGLRQSMNMSNMSKHVKWSMPLPARISTFKSLV